MRTILLGDIGNRMDIEDVETCVVGLKRRQDSARKQIVEKDLQIAELNSEVAKQRLAIQALTRFLVKKEILDENELNDFISEVDAEDGMIDGKMHMKLSPRKVKLLFDKPKR